MGEPHTRDKSKGEISSGVMLKSYAEKLKLLSERRLLEYKSCIDPVDKGCGLVNVRKKVKQATITCDVHAIPKLMLTNVFSFLHLIRHKFGYSEYCY